MGFKDRLNGPGLWYLFPMVRALFPLVVLLLFFSCSSRPSGSGVYFWRTTLDWSENDTRRLGEAGVDRLGLRLFDWGTAGEEGPLVVRSPLPRTMAVVPVVYVTTSRLESWAQDPGFEPALEARNLLAHMDKALSAAWPGTPGVWQLDADWTASTRAAWFAVAGAFRDLVHARGARFEVTVRLHQYRDRGAQGIPPADAGVLMLYGAGDAVLDRDLVAGYLNGPSYPLPLVPAFPTYTQVRQNNGYGRLVALHRLAADGDLPLADLVRVGPDHYSVVRRSSLGGRPLMAHDELFVDRVDPGVLDAVAALPSVAALTRAAGDRVWVFDYDPQGWEALVHGSLAAHLFPR